MIITEGHRVVVQQHWTVQSTTPRSTHRRYRNAACTDLTCLLHHAAELATGLCSICARSRLPALWKERDKALQLLIGAVELPL